MRRSVQLFALTTMFALVSWLSMGAKANGQMYPACNVTVCQPCYAAGVAWCWWGQAAEPVRCTCNMTTNQINCPSFQQGC